jgi:hypothetical protein
MAHYRKIDVNGKTYEYVVGRNKEIDPTYGKMLKIKGLGIWPASEVGKIDYRRCECCGDPLPDIYGTSEEYEVSVLPRHVRQVILDHT